MKENNVCILYIKAPYKVKNQCALVKRTFQIMIMQRCKIFKWELVLGAHME